MKVSHLLQSTDFTQFIRQLTFFGMSLCRDRAKVGERLTTLCIGKEALVIFSACCPATIPI